MKKYNTQIALFVILVAVLLGSLFFSSCDVLNINVRVVPSATATVVKSATPKPKITLTFSPTYTPTQPYYLNVPASALKGTQIRFWHPWQGDLAWKTADRVVEFNNTNPWGITVSFYAPDGPAMLVEAVNQSLTDGTIPNVVIAPSAMLAAWQDEYENLINLDEYIDMQEYGLNDQELADFTPVIWQQDTLAGQRFGYPVQRDAHVLVYNQTWATELGFPYPPVTPGQFQSQICSAKQALLKDTDTGNDGTGGWIVSNDEGTTLSWLLAFGYDGYSNLQQDIYQFEDSTAVQAFRFLRYLFDNECSWISRNPSPYPYFASRQALAFSAKLSELADIRSNIAFTESTDQWIVIPYPGEQKEQITLVEGQSFGMFASSPEEQLSSWLFMKWMNSPDYQAQIINQTGTFPITTSALANLESYGKVNTQWAAFVQGQTAIQTIPNGADWSRVRSVVADATWQLYQQAEVEDTTEAMSQIFNELDNTILELTGKN
jgi:ABC-type glycerol-3-phosphate transport system substrate-binding protein